MEEYFNDYMICLKGTYNGIKPQYIFHHLAEFLLALSYWLGIILIINFIKTYNHRKRKGNK